MAPQMPQHATHPTEMTGPSTLSPPSSGKRERGAESTVTNAGSASGAVQNHAAAPRPKGYRSTIDRPGLPSDPQTFLAVHGVEARLCAYVGFNDRKHLRRFLLSHIFLFYFNKFNHPWSYGMPLNKVFDYIREHLLDGKKEPHLPRIQALDRHRTEKGWSEELSWEPGNDYQRVKYVAHIIVVMTHHIKDAGSTIIIDAENQTTETQKFFAANRNCRGVPDLIGKEITVPRLERPDMEEESVMEAYNRSWSLLKNMQQVVMTEGLWYKRFAARYWDRDAPINPSFLPTWMQPEFEPPERTLPLNTITGRLIWHSQAALEQYLDELDKGRPPVSQLLFGDPRVETAFQYRDMLRRVLGCDELKLQLMKVHMMIPFRDRTYAVDLMTSDWDSIGRELNRVFGDDCQPLPGLNVNVQVYLRPLEDDEELFEEEEYGVQLGDA